MRGERKPALATSIDHIINLVDDINDREKFSFVSSKNLPREESYDLHIEYHGARSPYGARNLSYERLMHEISSRLAVQPPEIMEIYVAHLREGVSKWH